MTIHLSITKTISMFISSKGIFAEPEPKKEKGISEDLKEDVDIVT